ncbi:MAG: trigger factor [Candidatus Nomurabacteria bacterium]|nr:trigger factor [Candidatus Nomurabacteria bacterium]
MKFSTEKIENSQIKITGSIPSDDFAKHRDSALRKIAEKIKIDGFRPGKAPLETVAEKAGEAVVLEEMAHMAINEAYPKIIEDEKLNIIGYPQINITKLAVDNPLEFTIVTAVMPTVTLGDYKKIAKEHVKKSKPVTVADSEIDDALLEIRKMRVHQKMHDDKVEHDNHDHQAIDEKDLPEITDKWASELGDFKNVADLREKIKSNIELEKRGKAGDAQRIAIMDSIIADAELDVPPLLIDSELTRMTSHFQSDLERAGMKIEDYLKKADMTEEKLMSGWRTEAEHRAKMQLVLNKIATSENIEPDADRVEHEINMILEHHADADKRNVTAHVELVLTNQAVFEFLESQGVKKEKEAVTNKKEAKTDKK